MDDTLRSIIQPTGKEPQEKSTPESTPVRDLESTQNDELITIGLNLLLHVFKTYTHIFDAISIYFFSLDPSSSRVSNEQTPAAPLIEVPTSRAGNHLLLDDSSRHLQTNESGSIIDSGMFFFAYLCTGALIERRLSVVRFPDRQTTADGNIRWTKSPENALPDADLPDAPTYTIISRLRRSAPGPSAEAGVTTRNRLARGSLAVQFSLLSPAALYKLDQHILFYPQVSSK